MRAPRIQLMVLGEEDWAWPTQELGSGLGCSSGHVSAQGREGLQVAGGWASVHLGSCCKLVTCWKLRGLMAVDMF